MDIWYFFGCRGIDFLKENGIETYIAINNWITNFGASIFRNKVLRETQILDFIDFGNYKIFENADIQTMIYIIKKSNNISNYKVKYSKLLKDNLSDNELNIFLDNSQESCFYIKTTLDFCNKQFINDYIYFINSKDDSLLLKIKNGNKIFLQDEDMAQGIVAPQDFLNSKNQKILGKNFSVGESIFVITNEKKKQLNLMEEEEKIVKPLYTTEELNKYFANKNNNSWIIYTTSDFKNKSKMFKYPNLKKHLDRFQKIITSQYKPYGLHRSREESFFIGEKIVSLRKCLHPSFTYVDFDSYVLQTFYIIKPNNINLKYLTGVLNSKLIAYWLKKKGKMQGNNYQIDKGPLMNIPIYKPNQQQEKSMVNIVDKILSISRQSNYYKNIDNQNKVKKYEEQIDIMVYKLYKLTYEEVLIIDKNFNLSKEEYNNFTY